MKPIVLILLPLLCRAAVAANELSQVLDLARSAPGEFAADALIRVAAIETLEKPKRVEILEEAFRRASEAQEPLKREAAITRPGGPAGFLNHVNQQELDGLSLRLRAIDGMLPLDNHKAKDLFLQIGPLQVPKLACDEFMVYDLNRYYEVLGKIARQSFTAKEIARNEPVRWIESFLGTLTSPAQVAPVAHLLLQGGLKDTDLQALASSFAGTLGRISGDDRSFTHYASATGPAILSVVEELKKRKLNSLPLVEGYRLYLVNNMTGARCADDDLMQNGTQAYSMSSGRVAAEVGGEAGAFFNHRIQMAPLQPLSENEMTPSKVEGAASGLRGCRDAECKSISEQFRGLIFDANGTPFTLKQKDTVEWRGKLQQFLNALASWKQSTGVSDDEYFREKSELYNGLVGVLSNGTARQDALRSWLDYLRQSRSQVANRAEWFLPVSALIGRVSLDPLGLGKLAEELSKVNDPVIALYVELERVAPRSPDRILNLL